ncbi:hypothetical protein ACH5RR_021266 [Cinchona calisaya]|uniref:Reverse transcriptase domain-containing protein n=1 Tax=Cinchona calisaya TaxID=153742 RepID=A0ABD2ZJQ2_9GENT
MPCIPRKIIEHKLGVDPACKPVKQRKRLFDPGRSLIIETEVDKLLIARLIREVLYPTWLCNPVHVTKPDSSWQMCQDFTNLNKACPKDSYPYPRIDTVVDSFVGFYILHFLDAFKVYHQIYMARKDEEKTSFITDRSTYYYSTMSFGFKNTGATYQRLVNKTFKSRIGRNMEVYIDDMVVKSRTYEEILEDLRETFETLRSIQMRLNPKKYTFGVPSKKFLGFIVSHRRIEANPEKVQAIINMKTPTSVKEVQRLTGRMAALNRFLSKSAERGLLFF